MNIPARLPLLVRRRDPRLGVNETFRKLPGAGMIRPLAGTRIHLNSATQHNPGHFVLQLPEAWAQIFPASQMPRFPELFLKRREADGILHTVRLNPRYRPDTRGSEDENVVPRRDRYCDDLLHDFVRWRLLVRVQVVNVGRDLHLELP